MIVIKLLDIYAFSYLSPLKKIIREKATHESRIEKTISKQTPQIMLLALVESEGYPF